MAKDELTGALADEDGGETILEWIQERSRPLSYGAIGLATVAVVWWMVSSFSAKKEANASSALGEAQRVYASGNMPLAQSDLQKFVQRYGGTKAGIQGRLLLAQVMFDQKQLDSGLKVLKEVGSPGPFASGYHSIMAAGLEQAKRLDEAAQEFLKASEAALSEVDKATFKGDAARVLAAAGKLEDARKLWGEIAADDANPLAGEARVRLGELSAKAVPKG